MSMNGNNLATEITSAMSAVSPTPVNTYQQRLFVALANAIVTHIQTNAAVTAGETYVAGTGSNGGNLAAPLGIVAGTTVDKGTVN